MYVPAWQGISPSLLLGGSRPSPPPYPLSASSRRYFYLARSGIYHAARTLLQGNGQIVLAPAYHNGLEILALRAAGAKPRFFRIDRRTQPDLDGIRVGLRNGARLVLVIHFNGWPQPIEEIRSLCREYGAALLEDCALAFLSRIGDAALGTFGDASVFCLYKTLPVPNGAVLAMNGGTDFEAPNCGRNPGWLSTLARTSELVINHIRSRSDRVGHTLAVVKSWMGTALAAAKIERVPVGSMRFDESVLDLAMSPWAIRLLGRFDYSAIRDRRRFNFQMLQTLLGENATPLHPDLPEGVCPLFFPLLVEDKGTAVRALRARGVEAVEFWNTGDPEADAGSFADAMELRRRVIELPIHQDLTPSHIEFMAHAVLELGLRTKGRG